MTSSEHNCIYKTAVNGRLSFPILSLFAFVMNSSEPSTRTWLGYVTAEVVHKCVTMCSEECLACRNGIISPLLHFHNELNLKDKLHRYLSRVVIDLDHLFDQFILQFGWFALNRQHFIQLAEIFLNVSTPDAILYGKYIRPDNDQAIYGQPDPIAVSECKLDEGIVSATSDKPLKRQPSTKTTIKAKRSKKTDISQNATPGNDP